jgi:cytochrome c-type biogenesis protein CcsB
MGIEEILSRNVFLLSIEINILWLVTLLYIISFFLHIIHLITKDIGRLASLSLYPIVILHTLLIIFRMIEGGRPPFQTLYESLSWFSWSVVVTYIYTKRYFRDIHIPGIFITLIASSALVYAIIARNPAIEPLNPALQSNWFVWHVILSFLSYAVFVVSSSIEITYLIFNRAVGRGEGLYYGFKPDMMELFHRRAYLLVLFGFPLLTFGIFSGAAWADQAWGRFWGWDPKETWSLITWTIFAIYLHSYSIPKWRGRPASIFNILGFVCMIITFVGVNWLSKIFGIPSLHTYAL